MKKMVSGVCLLIVMLVISLTLMSCATRKTTSSKSKSELLAESEQIIKATNQSLETLKQACQSTCGENQDCQCWHDIEAMERENIELTLVYADVWNKEYSTDSKYGLIYYWAPKEPSSQQALKNLLYVLADPQFKEQDQLNVVLVSKGDWDDLWPNLTQVVYDLRADIPDLEQFLKTIRFQVATEKCGYELPADNELPFLGVLKGEAGKYTPILSVPLDENLPWIRESPITRNTMSAVLMLAEEKSSK